MLQAKGEDKQTRVAESHFQKAIAEMVRVLKFIQLLEPIIADARQLIVSFSRELSQIGRLDMVRQLGTRGSRAQRRKHTMLSSVGWLGLLRTFSMNLATILSSME